MADAHDGDTNRLPNRFVVGTVAACVLPFVLHAAGWSFSSSGDGGEIIHSLFEWSAMCASLFTVFLGLLYLRVRPDLVVLTMVVAAMFSSLWDAMHTFGSIGMVPFSSDLDDLLPLTWALSRTFRALCFMLGATIIIVLTPNRARFVRGAFLAGVITLVLVAAGVVDLVLQEPLPAAQFSERLIKRPWDLPALILFATNGLVLLPILARRQPTILSRSLWLSAIPDIGASAVMVFGSASLYDFPFYAAHSLKLVAPVVLCIGISLAFVDSFKRERRVTSRLERTAIELTKAEDELKIKEVQLNLLSENIREVLWLGSTDGSTIFYVSPAYEEIFGLSCQSIYETSDSYLEVVHPDDRQKMIESAARDHEEDLVLEFRILKNGNELRWLRTRGFPIRDDDGKVYRLAGITEDITDSKIAAEALLNSEARNRALLEAMPDLMFRLDRSGTILDCHASSEIPLYREPSHFLGKNLAAVVPDLGERVIDALSAALDENTMQIVEYRLDIDNLTANYEARFVRSAENEVLVLVRDITEQKRLEKEVLDVSNREQHRIAHDLHDGISQQLTGIALMCKALQRQLAANGVPEAVRARQIEELADQAIAQTRSLARGLAPVQLEEGGLWAALEELALGVETRHTVQCQLHSEVEIPVQSHAFATHLYRIAQEAVNNAIQHADPSSISIRVSRPNSRMRLSVRDDGRGIEDLASGDRNGDGMGLHIMRYRARIIDASLKIQSAPGKGTTVSVEWSTSADS